MMYRFIANSVYDDGPIETCSMHNAVDKVIVLGKLDDQWGTWIWVEGRGFNLGHYFGDDYRKAKDDWIKRIQDND